MLAEDETPVAHEHGFDMTYSWELFRLMAAIAKGDSNAAALDRYFAREALYYPPRLFECGLQTIMMRIRGMEQCVSDSKTGRQPLPYCAAQCPNAF